jgi:hypothetical protein
MLDLGKSSRLIDESLAMADEIAAFAPTLAIVQHGGAESLVHPGPMVDRLITRFAPPTWHGVSGLMPRAYYSGDPQTGRRQRRLSALKVAIKRLVIALSGGRSRMTPQTFGTYLEALIATLHGIDCDVVVLSMYRWDQRLFPGSMPVVEDTDRIIRRITAADPRVALVDLQMTLRCWDDYLEDRMHWNAEGHVRAAGAILATVAPLLAERAERRPTAPPAPSSTAARLPA